MQTLLTTWILIIPIGFSTIGGAGVGTIQFVQYSNPTFKDDDGKCCESVFSTACGSGQCDPYLEICIDLEPPSGNCKYGKGKTRIYDNTDQITFGNSVGGLSNPLTFIIEKGVSIGIVGYDDDDTWLDTTDDLMGTIQTSYTDILGNGSIATPNTQTLTGGQIRVDVILSFACDVFYYGDCTKYCQDVPGRYTCDSNGDIVCLPAWTGPLCDIRTDDCYINSCMNNATCVDGNASYMCVCGPQYTGIHCETLQSTVRTSAVTTTPPTTPKTTTITTTTPRTTPITTTTSRTTPITTTTSRTTPITTTTPRTTPITTTTHRTTPITTTNSKITPTTNTTFTTTYTTTAISLNTTSASASPISTPMFTTSTPVTNTTVSATTKPIKVTTSTKTMTTITTSVLNSTAAPAKLSTFTTVIPISVSDNTTTVTKTSAKTTPVDPSPTTSSTSPPVGRRSTTRPLVGNIFTEPMDMAIVGGAVGGGIAVFSTAAVIGFFVRKKCRKDKTSPGTNTSHYGTHQNTKSQNAIHGAWA